MLLDLHFLVFNYPSSLTIELDVFFPFPPQNKLSSASFFRIWWKRHYMKIPWMLCLLNFLLSILLFAVRQINRTCKHHHVPIPEALQNECSGILLSKLPIFALQHLPKLKISMSFTCSSGISYKFTWYSTEGVPGENVTYPIVLGKQPLKY